MSFKTCEPVRRSSRLLQQHANDVPEVHPAVAVRRRNGVGGDAAGSVECGRVAPQQRRVVQDRDAVCSGDVEPAVGMQPESEPLLVHHGVVPAAQAHEVAQPHNVIPTPTEAPPVEPLPRQSRDRECRQA